MSGHVSRRALLKGTAAGTAAVAAPAAAARASSAPGLIRSVDVAVVGAGISGLYAAYLLSHHPGTSFAVIEARDRTGGRIIRHGLFDSFAVRGIITPPNRRSNRG